MDLTREQIEMVRTGLLQSDWCGYSKIKTINALCDMALRARAEGEPVLWVRMLDGKIDWGEDCVFASPEDGQMDCYDAEDGYTAIPLYTRPAPSGMVLTAISMLDELGHDISSGAETKKILSDRAHKRANDLRAMLAAAPVAGEGEEGK